MRPDIQFIDEENGKKVHKYIVNGEEYPSVTKILDTVVPKNLGWWGQTTGVEGVCELYHKGKITEWHPEIITSLLTENKLTVNHRRDARGSVGLNLHKALQDYAEKGIEPTVLGFAPEDHPRVIALNRWLHSNQPEFQSSEVVTASLEHRYAGTYDFRATLTKGKHAGAYVLGDLKSTKYIYPDSHWPQLEAYESAEVECGEEPTDFRMVLHLPPEGDAVGSISTDTFEDFLLLKAHYDSIQNRKARLKQAKQLAKMSAD